MLLEKGNAIKKYTEVYFAILMVSEPFTKIKSEA
jgi:hypothetical protein